MSDSKINVMVQKTYMPTSMIYGTSGYIYLIALLPMAGPTMYVSDGIKWTCNLQENQAQLQI